MPIQQIAENTKHIASNTEVISHLADAGKIVGPFMAVIIALIVAAWRKLEKTQDKLELAFCNYVKENDGVHDKVFTELRVIGKDIVEVKTRQSDCENCP